MADEPHVLAEVVDGIGWITLNRPEQLNTLSPEMKEIMFETTAKFERDAAVRCVVIRGNGRHFMAGGNIKAFNQSLSHGDREAFSAASRPAWWTRTRRSIICGAWASRCWRRSTARSPGSA